MSQVGVYGTLRHRYGLGAESTPIVIIVIVIAICFMTDGDFRPAFAIIIIIIIVHPDRVVVLVVVVLIVTVVVVVATPEIPRVIVAGERRHTETRYQADGDYQLRYTES